MVINTISRLRLRFDVETLIIATGALKKYEHAQLRFDVETLIIATPWHPNKDGDLVAV